MRRSRRPRGHGVFDAEAVDGRSTAWRRGSGRVLPRSRGGRCRGVVPGAHGEDGRDAEVLEFSELSFDVFGGIVVAGSVWSLSTLPTWAVAVDERGHEEFAGHIDLGGAGRDGESFRGRSGQSRASANHEGDVGLLLAAGAVDEGEVIEEDGSLPGLCEGGTCEKEEDQGVSHTRKFEWKVRIFPGRWRAPGEWAVDRQIFRFPPDIGLSLDPLIFVISNQS